MSTAKIYRIDMEHTFLIKTTDIEEVILNYHFPDFIDCKSIIDEAEYEGGGTTWTELAELEINEVA